MGNFNPENHDNTVNPYTLSPQEQADIMETIDDERLTNPTGDYFKLKIDDQEIDIPKLKTVSTKTASGTVKSISTVTYIQEKLNAEVDK